MRLEHEGKARLEEQLQQARKMESLGSLAGGIAHDMNNVLGAILGMASARIEDHPEGGQTHRAFATIIKAAERGGKMVKSLLSFARQSPAERRELDLNVIIREEVELLERTTLSKVHLEMDLESRLRPILGDASALNQAIMNLCVNAVDAMPEPGTLTLRTRNQGHEWIEVLVEDTGSGMTAEVLERALEPFFTTKDVGKGTGLGLSMVYSIVKAHHGQMEIHSEVGLGTQVRMRFPACEPAGEAIQTGAETRVQAARQALKVLLVDDDELIQSSTKAILQALGHGSLTAPDGESALAVIEAGFEPDVVILDMNMPGLGGIGTLPRLRSLLPEVPILLATGRADQTALSLVEAHQDVTLMLKPFGKRELQENLGRLGWG
jgi:CheY-like chemotaxis protein